MKLPGCCRTEFELGSGFGRFLAAKIEFSYGAGQTVNLLALRLQWFESTPAQGSYRVILQARRTHRQHKAQRNKAYSRKSFNCCRAFTKSTRSVRFWPIASGTTPNSSIGRFKRFTQNVG